MTGAVGGAVGWENERGRDGVLESTTPGGTICSASSALTNGKFGIRFDNSWQVRTADETRVKSLSGRTFMITKVLI